VSEGVQLYAGTQDGLVVVKENGAGWKTDNHVFQGRVVESLSGARSNPERVYAGVAYDGLYRTDDGGKNWKKILDGDIRSTTVDPTDDNVIYTGTEPPRLFRSEDRGDHFEEITSLQKLPEELRKNWWTPYPPNSGHIMTIFIHPDDPKMIYLSLEHGGILRSFDRGETWEDVSKGIDYLDIHIITSVPHRFDKWFVSSARGFFTTDDPGRGWTRAESGFTRDYFHDFIFLDPENGSGDPTMVIATADHSPGSWARPEFARSAVFRSVDGAKNWERVLEGFEEEMNPMVWALHPHPLNKNAAFAGVGHVIRGPADGPTGPGSIHITRDRGQSFEKLIDIPGDRVLWAATV